MSPARSVSQSQAVDNGYQLLESLMHFGHFGVNELWLTGCWVDVIDAAETDGPIAVETLRALGEEADDIVFNYSL